MYSIVYTTVYVIVFTTMYIEQQCCFMCRQGRLQFRPAFEEVRAKYYREMKRFISIPNQFKGVSEPGEESIFSRMIERNASSFLTVYSKAEQLFSRLLGVQDTFKVKHMQLHQFTHDSSANCQ